MSEDNTISVPAWEQQLNALLDGELDAEGVAQLRAAAAGDPRRSRAIIEADLLRRELAAIPPLRAPASLRRKLRAIPRQSGSPVWFPFSHPGWLAGLAATVLAVMVIDPSRNPPTDTETIAGGRHDLAVALAYLDRATQRATSRVTVTIDQQFTVPVTRNVASVLDQQLDLIGSEP